MGHRIAAQGRSAYGIASMVDGWANVSKPDEAAKVLRALRERVSSELLSADIYAQGEQPAEW